MRFVGLVLAIAPLLIAQQPAANPQPARPEDKCVIEGQVLNAQTGEPVKKARVRVTGSSQPGRVFSAASDAGGRFTIEEIEPGTYSMFAERNGFVQAQYGAGWNRVPALLVLSPGQRLRDVSFRLVPQGVITGRVVDEDGEPVEHVQVSATRRIRSGRPNGQTGFAQTDDQGEYRIFGLEAGKYFLSAIYRQPSMMWTQDRTAGAGFDEDYAPTFYPGTNDPAGAVAINVQPGAQLRSVDIKLSKTRTVRIRGKVTSPLGEALTARTVVNALPRDKTAMEFFASHMTQARNPNGTFELRGLTPGSYVLIAQSWVEGKMYTARQPVDAGNTNVNDVELTLAGGVEVRGTVHVDGPANTPLGRLQVTLGPREMMRMGKQGAIVASDGSFKISDVPANLYSVAVFGMPETFYLSSIHQGDADVLDGGLDLTRGGGAQLEIVLSPNGGQVEGSVVDGDAKPAGNAVVVMAPEGRRREEPAFYKVTGTDAQGHFTLKGIAPGDYRLFALPQIEGADFQDPEFLKPYENEAERVSIRESGHESVQLKLIAVDAKEGGPGT